MAFSFHRIPVGICNCYLLRGERTILIDAGAPMGMGSFVSRLKQLNVDPKEISLILLTHGRWDHIASLAPIREMTGQRSPSIIGISPSWSREHRLSRRESMAMGAS
ncbi:MAG: MBL fold metallo-hydrolase [Chloroflexi bacterium]|nr:MBL fold metallo-hydrolase [Chloroflexota bacterium]